MLVNRLVLSQQRSKTAAKEYIILSCEMLEEQRAARVFVATFVRQTKHVCQRAGRESRVGVGARASRKM